MPTPPRAPAADEAGPIPDVPPVSRLADADVARLVDRRRRVPDAVRGRAADIVRAVRTGGDEALRRLTRELEGCDLEDPWLGQAAWDAAVEQVPQALRDALLHNAARIEAFHARQVGGPDEIETMPGVRLGRTPVPYRHVACYVPGGRASYPSTVLMTVVPARLAGVEDIIVVTPPRADGTVDPVVLAAARIAGASRVLRAGGAQAVAAVAYGTETIAAVEAIVGPGNAFVTAAKEAVAADGVAWTDAPAGPSELLVLADGTAPAEAIAWDLLAQAEHDPDAQVVLVTDDRELAERVRAEVVRRFPDEPRAGIIRASLRDHGALLVADRWDDAVAFADAYAAEHLEIVSRDPRSDLGRIRNAGSVFLGPHAPVSLGDYGSGTNHVLPTMGHARIRGGLDVDDFRKWITWQEVSADGLAAVAADITAVADAEGLAAHAAAVRRRLA